MGHGVAESFQLFVRGFQLGGTLYDSVFEFFIEFSNLSLIRSTPSDVAESHYSSTHHAVFVFQGTTAGFDPGTLGHLWITQKYLGSAHFSVNRTYQWELFGRHRSDSV